MKKFKSLFPMSFKDTVITILIILCACIICMIMRQFDDGDIYVSMIFLLAVLIAARYTDGYFYGIATSIIGVFCVNYVFTYPYMEFNFTISGYPITFLSMIVASVITSMMTTQVKEREKLKVEAETEKMRSNLLRAVSHDLRTPLTSILGGVSAMLENEETINTEKKRDLLSDIKADAEWLIRMVENLLSVTKLREGSSNLQKGPEVAEEIVAEAVAKYKKRWMRMIEAGKETDGVKTAMPTVTVKVPDEFLLIPMDALLIEQVIINLVENAAFHAKGAKNIWLSVYNDAKTATFEVVDDGAGIAPELIDHIFDGYRTSGSDTGRDMGIGLSVCKSIIAAHGGTMHAENTENAGARFTFTLPLEE